MALISAEDAAQVKTFFDEQLQDSVTVELFTQKRSLLVVPGRQECEYCEETEQLLGEVAALSDKIELKVHDLRATPDAGVEQGVSPAMLPAFILRGATKGNVRYFGIPAGYEFMSLLQDLADVSSGTTKLTEATRDELAMLASDVHIRVFVTPT